MKPMVSDANLRDAVLKELERDPEIVAKYISVTAIDGVTAVESAIVVTSARARPS